MINLRSGLVEDHSRVVLTFFDHSFASFGQNKAGNSPGIANKKGTLLWDNQFPLDFCLWSDYHVSSPILLLKLSLSLFLAKIYNKEV